MGYKLVTDLAAGAAAIRQARYGVIECRAGRLRHIRLRAWPKWIALDELLWGRLAHHWSRGDRCRIYYNQPRGASNFLAVKYALSTRDCSVGTMLRSLAVLDQVAWLKQTDALVCDAWNPRISDRSLARYGWEAHLPGSWHRHYIKRFYGKYPKHARVEGLSAGNGTQDCLAASAAECCAALE